MAFKLINSSVLKGYGYGYRVLGWMYEKGEGIQQDLGMAIDMYKCAVEHGCIEAEKELRRLVPCKYEDSSFK